MITTNVTYRLTADITARQKQQPVTLRQGDVIKIMKLDSDTANAKLISLSADPKNRHLLTANKVDVALNSEAY